VLVVVGLGMVGVASAGMVMVAITGAGRVVPSGVAGSMVLEGRLFLFFLASDVAKAGPLDRATRAIWAMVVDFGSVSHEGSSWGDLFVCEAMCGVRGGRGLVGVGATYFIRLRGPFNVGCC